MFVALIIVHIICSVALILIVLLQAGKGAGISNVFGGAGQTVFGARTGDVLARGTEVCAGLFMVTSLGLAMVSSDRSSSVMRKHYAPMSQPQPGIPLSPDQQAAMNKLKQAFAGITNTVKQAATQATVPQGAVPATQPAAPVGSAPTTPSTASPATTSAPAPVAAAVPAAASAQQPASSGQSSAAQSSAATPAPAQTPAK